MKFQEPYNLADHLLEIGEERSGREGVAIEYGERRLSYAALRGEVVAWRERLAGWGVAPGDRVALLLYDSPEWVAIFLAAAAAGALAVPMNPYLPRPEVEYILRDANVKLITAESEIMDRYREAAEGGERVGNERRERAGGERAESGRGGEGAASGRGERRESKEGSERGERGEGGEVFAGCDVVEIETATRAPGRARIGGEFFEDADAIRGVRAAELEMLPVVTGRETPAFMLYTSGSTGTPKGALHLHGAIAVTVENYAAHVLNLTPADRVFSASRLFFAYGLGNSLSFPLAAGATVILESARPTPASVAELFRAKRPTVFFGVPALYAALLEHHRQSNGLDVSSLRLCVSAGEALPGPVFEDWRQTFGLEILDGIGSTEMLHIFISNRQGSGRAGSSGQLVEGYEARLIDEGGREVADGEPGNLWVRGGSAFSGYWGREDLTREAIRDGWVRTGDVYRRDAGGFYFHIGRSDDCFKVRGLWVSPVEVESALLEHPAVAEAAVVAAVDERGLATSRAFVVIRQGVAGEECRAELRAFLGTRLPAYKVPSRIEFVESLPRTATGKVQRFRLRSAGLQTPGGHDE